MDPPRHHPASGGAPRDERRLILLRHGESTWNRENRFTGWTDVDLSVAGIAASHSAARRLAEAGLDFDVALTSVPQRAIRTLWIVLDDLDRMWVPVHRSWRLNERHYGALHGLNKAETAAQFGVAQVHRWRRSYGVRPPLLEPGDARWERDAPRYTELCDAELPRGAFAWTSTSTSLPTSRSWKAIRSRRQSRRRFAALIWGSPKFSSISAPIRPSPDRRRREVASSPSR